MAEKEISNIIKLQIPAGKATPAPPVGPALGSSGVNIMQFVKEFNDRTANQPGMIIPVVITVYKDKSFEFITKVPPVAVLIKKSAKIEKGSGKPNKDKVATITSRRDCKAKNARLKCCFIRSCNEHGCRNSSFYGCCSSRLIRI